MKKPLIIGLAGGSCSGKSSISRIVKRKLDTKSVTILHEKGYYKNGSAEPTLENKEKNFDHPEVFNNTRLLSDLKQLINGHSIIEPFYDFKTHQQVQSHNVKHPAKVIIVEGTLALYDERLRKLMDIHVFVDAAEDIMLLRRLKRNHNRHISMNDTFKHYIYVVKPMYQQFILPTQRYADIIIPENWRSGIAIDTLVARINSLIK